MPASIEYVVANFIISERSNQASISRERKRRNPLLCEGHSSEDQGVQVFIAINGNQEKNVMILGRERVSVFQWPTTWSRVLLKRSLKRRQIHNINLYGSCRVVSSIIKNMVMHNGRESKHVKGEDFEKDYYLSF